jgi:hypothetical protein
MNNTRKKDVSNREKLIIESFYNVLERIENKNLDEQEIEEGFKNSMMAVAMAASSLLGANKSHGQSMTNPAATSQSSVKATQQNVLNVPIGTLFRSGRYIIGNEKQEEIKAKLVEIGNFVEAHPNTNFQVNIKSSESLVPNKNADSASIGSDGTGKPMYAPLGKGELANKRNQTATELINTFMDQLKKQGLLKGQVKIDKPEAIIGTSPYKQGDNPAEDRFSQEQYTNIVITAVAAANSSDSSTGIDFSKYSQSNDIMLDNNQHGIAVLLFPTSKSNTVKNNGSLDTPYENVVISFLGAESVKTGMASTQGQFNFSKSQKASGPSFKVPWAWYNQNIKNHTITPQNVKDIVSHNFGQSNSTANR